jgi:SpoVK/Ycf46/Vps4 family AAA+-type ATPase
MTLVWRAHRQADWKDVILPSALQYSIKHEYASFFSSESIYKDLGVAWKRGVIFLGPPGNGKTISVKAMMRDVLLGDGGVGKEEEKRVLYVRSFHSESRWRDGRGDGGLMVVLLWISSVGG